MNCAAFIGRKCGGHRAHCSHFAAARFEQIFDLEDALPLLKRCIELQIAVESIVDGLVVQSHIVVNTVRNVKVGVFLRLLYHCYFCSMVFPDYYDEICCCLRFLINSYKQTII